jgi:XTP/dITP diphosphohydrolase
LIPPIGIKSIFLVPAESSLGSPDLDRVKNLKRLMPIPLLIASYNFGKVREIQEFLSGQAIECIGLESLQGIPSCVESGKTFEENARQKAVYYSRASLGVTLADDSGLMVDALNGQPGIYSVRFVSESATDEQRYQEVLYRLRSVPAGQRTARFICVIVLALRGRILAAFEGKVEGQIAIGPRGSNGFGYDPIFYIPEKGKTLAELTSDEKLAISHRGQALSRMREALLLPGFLESLQT